MVNPAFTSGLPTGSTQKTGAYITVGKTSTARNVLTKLDDHGLQAGIERAPGESLTNFKARLKSQLSRLPGSKKSALTNAIANELGMHQFPMFSVTANQDFKLDVVDTEIRISGANSYNEIALISLDTAGNEIHQSATIVLSGLNAISGISATMHSNVSGSIPAMLLENQSSYEYINSELIENSQSFYLGKNLNIDKDYAKLVTSQIEFSDPDVFAVQVSGTPSKKGEWQAATDWSILVYEDPADITYANYVYNLLPSGATLDLIANSAKVINLGDLDVQELHLTISGVSYSMKDYTNELLDIDRLFWDK